MIVKLRPTLVLDHSVEHLVCDSSIQEKPSTVLQAVLLTWKLWFWIIYGDLDFVF